MVALKYSHEAGVARLVIANPPQNRLDDAVQADFAAAIADIKGRTDTRAVYVTAEGPDYSWGAGISGWNDLDPAGVEAWLGEGVDLMNEFEDLPYPIVTAVQGNCLGGGLELALRADIIVAAESAHFGHPEVTIGIFTLAGGVQRVAERVGRTRAIEWSFTGERIPAPVARAVGLINQVVPDNELDTAAGAWVERLAKGPTLSYADHKTILRTWSREGIEAADKIMPAMASKTMLSDDAQGSLKSVIKAVMEGKPRPAYPFQGR